MWRQGEEVEVGQGSGHACGDGLVIAPAFQRVQPEDAAAAFRQAFKGGADVGGGGGVVAVRQDHHDGAAIDMGSGMGGGEVHQRRADARAAAEAVGQQGDAVQGAEGVFIPQRSVTRTRRVWKR